MAMKFQRDLIAPPQPLRSASEVRKTYPFLAIRTLRRFTDGGKYLPDQLARAQENLRLARETWRQFFTRYDFLVMPCAPFPALRKADCTPEARRAILRLTAPASLGGLPVLTIPVPLASGLSGGLQIIARDAASPVFPWALRQL